MFFRIPRLILVLAILLAAPMAVHAQQPLPADSSGRIGWPVAMTPRQHITVSTFFGATLGATAGAVAGWGAAQMECPPQNREILGCTAASNLPRYGVTLGAGTGAWWAAARAGAEAGCTPPDPRRRARSGAIRGFVVGVAPAADLSRDGRRPTRGLDAGGGRIGAAGGFHRALHGRLPAPALNPRLQLARAIGRTMRRRPRGTVPRGSTIHPEPVT
jgi:hypothetical protein